MGTAPYFVLFSVFILLFLILHLLRKAQYASKYLKNIGGPKPIFPFGNTLELIRGSIDIFPKLFKFHEEHGDTLIFCDGAFSKVLSTIDYDLSEYFYSSTEHIQKADQYNFFGKWLGQGLLTSAGHKWKTHRKAITPAFHFSILKNFISVFDAVGDNLVKQLRKESGKDSVEISKVISLYALDVICEAAMGIKIHALEGENSIYIEGVKSECSVVMSRIYSPLNQIFFPLTWNSFKEKRALKVIHPFVENVISQRIQQQTNSNFSNSGDDDGKKRLAFLDLLLQIKVNGQNLSKEDLRDEVNTFMFEGHDTTSSAITFCLLMVATHPEVQDKLLKEQVMIFNNDIKDAIPSFTQLNEMKYLELVIKETLRLFPSVPLFGRKLTKDLEFKGVLYPEGLPIMLLPFLVHRSKKYFSDPEKFIPERFENHDGKLPFSYTPFSAGPRNCIGQKFAMLEIASVVSKILRNFELGPAVPEHNIQLAVEVILISKNGVRISIKNRTYSNIE